MEGILEVVGGKLSNLACSSIETKSGSVLGDLDLGVGCGNEGLCVTVGESLRTLTCKCRCNIGVNGHLGIGGPLKRRREETMGMGDQLLKVRTNFFFFFWLFVACLG